MAVRFRVVLGVLGSHGILPSRRSGTNVSPEKKFRRPGTRLKGRRCQLSEIHGLGLAQACLLQAGRQKRWKSDMESLVHPTKPPRRDGKVGKASKSGSSTANKALITRNLRLVYDEIAGEQIPDRMIELLNQLGAKEGKGS
jgi:hypothetical protein